MNYQQKYKKYKTKYLQFDDRKVKRTIFELPGFQSIIIAKDNNIIFEYGNTKYNREHLASCRKSILAILYGMYPIDINKKLGEISNGDRFGFSEIQEMATIRDLLMGRYFIKGDDKNLVYINWNLDVLGPIFEEETGVNIYDALDNLGKQIGFEDFDLDYNKNSKKPVSEYPPYHMFLSARDMLKIGYLMLNKGKYNGKQIVPREWIKEITTLYTKIDEENMGYGYLWWIYDKDKDHPLYKAYATYNEYVEYGSGDVGGQLIAVIPKSNMVIVTKNYLPREALLAKIFGLKN